MVYGLWFIVYGLWLRVWGLGFTSYTLHHTYEAARVAQGLGVGGFQCRALASEDSGLGVNFKGKGLASGISGLGQTCGGSLGPHDLPRPPIREIRVVINWYSSQFKNNHFTEMCCGNEKGSYLTIIDSCITQLQAEGPSRTCNESKQEEEEKFKDEGFANLRWLARST